MSADAVGEVLIAPFDLDGRFVCPAMRQRVIELELGRLIRDEQRGVYGMDR